MAKERFAEEFKSEAVRQVVGSGTRIITKKASAFYQVSGHNYSARAEKLRSHKTTLKTDEV